MFVGTLVVSQLLFKLMFLCVFLFLLVQVVCLKRSSVRGISCATMVSVRVLHFHHKVSKVEPALPVFTFCCTSVNRLINQNGCCRDEPCIQSREMKQSTEWYLICRDHIKLYSDWPEGDHYFHLSAQLWCSIFKILTAGRFLCTMIRILLIGKPDNIFPTGRALIAVKKKKNKTAWGAAVLWDEC